MKSILNKMIKRYSIYLYRDFRSKDAPSECKEIPPESD